MRNLIFINGTMGSGKSAVSQKLFDLYPNSIYLDGDDCWCVEPLIVNEQTKKEVIDNIVNRLNGYLAGIYEYIIFSWVMHEESIIDDITSRLRGEYRLFKFTLIGSRSTIIANLNKDIENGKRKMDVIERSLYKLPMYIEMKTKHINIDNKSIDTIAQEIKKEVDLHD